MRIVFHTNQLCFRGTSTALFDYAYYARELLGHDVLILANDRKTKEALPKFAAEFEVLFYQDPREIDNVVQQKEANVLYMIKSGRNDGISSASCRNVVHAVFMDRDPHGERYAYVSEWLARSADWPHFVPHIVNPLPQMGDLRDELGIPKDALVFGRHGGNDSFDIDFVKKCIFEIAKTNPNIYFLFLNTDKFVSGLPNVIHLMPTSNVKLKSKFIQTCDAMIHARARGETFGLAVAEFSISNKPVLTWSGSRERAHIEVLQDKGLYYESFDDLKNLIKNFEIDKTVNWDCYSEKFSPNVVMQQFHDVFLA